MSEIARGPRSTFEEPVRGEDGRVFTVENGVPKIVDFDPSYPTHEEAQGRAFVEIINSRETTPQQVIGAAGAHIVEMRRVKADPETIWREEPPRPPEYLNDSEQNQ